MTLILGADGKPVRVEVVGCPACGETGTKVRTSGFGGHWKDVCNKCGHVFARGRGDARAEYEAGSGRVESRTEEA